MRPFQPGGGFQGDGGRLWAQVSRASFPISLVGDARLLSDGKAANRHWQGIPYEMSVQFVEERLGAGHPRAEGASKRQQVMGKALAQLAFGLHGRTQPQQLSNQIREGDHMKALAGGAVAIEVVSG